MSHHQILSKHFEAPQIPDDTYSARELLIKGSKERQLKPFSSSDQSRRDFIHLVRGFLLTFFSLVLLVICLWQFSKPQRLSKWEQRSFNALSILLSGIASLGLGSLLEYLGSMLRWPLLARRMYQMQDVWLLTSLKKTLLTIKIGGLNTGHVATNWLSATHPTTYSRVADIANDLYCHYIPRHKYLWEIKRCYFRFGL